MDNGLQLELKKVVYLYVKRIDELSIGLASLYQKELGEFSEVE